MAELEYYMNLPLEKCELVEESVETVTDVYEIDLGTYAHTIIIYDEMEFDENGIWRGVHTKDLSAGGGEVYIPVIKRDANGVYTGMLYRVPQELHFDPETGTTAMFPTEQISSIDSLLQPYQEVIDRLNAEFGVDVYIPDDNKEEVYNNLKRHTLAEFEEKLRRELSVEVCHVDEVSNIIDDQVFREYAEDHITILPADIGPGNEITAIPLG